MNERKTRQSGSGTTKTETGPEPDFGQNLETHTCPGPD